MAYINNWDETVDADSCISFDIWNDMIDYISCPTSAKTDFFIYSDCLTRENQKFKFTYDDDNSIIYGANTTGYDLILQANSIDTYPYIILNGNSNILLNSYSNVIFELQNTPTFKFDFAGSESSLYGSENTGDDLTIYANTTDSSPSITLNGDGQIHLKVKNDGEIVFKEDLVQFFKFDHSGDDSLLYGGESANDDLNIYANSSDAYPVIELYGASNINLNTHSNVLISVQNETAFTFNLDTDESRLYGSDDAGDDLTVYANSVDSSPSLTLLGDGEIQLKVKTDEEILFLQGDNTKQFFKFDHSGDDSFLYGGETADDDLIIKANSSDTYPFIELDGASDVIINAQADTYIKIQNNQLFKFDISGTISRLFGGSDAGDDLGVYANSNESCAKMLLYGNGDVIVSPYYTGIFEISTCSGEKLFEVSAPSMAINHRCMQAMNFRVECLTADPSGATCQGRIWLRTDLV